MDRTDVSHGAWAGVLRFLTRHGLLYSILVLALCLRVYNLDFGLPRLLHPDEKSILLPALRIADLKKLDLDPRFYNYPSLNIYLMAAAFYAKGVLNSGGSMGNPSLPDLVEAAYLGRWLTALFGLATVGAVYAAGILHGHRRTGLIASLLLAVAPFHALDSHYANVDVPAAFFCLLAYCLALGCIRTQRLYLFLLTATAIGFAGGAKYTGLILVFLLPVICFCLIRSGLGLKRCGLLLVAGLAVCLAAFLFCAPYTVIEYDAVMKALEYERAHMQEGQWGWDLKPGGILFHRFIYQLMAGLPFTLGVPLYASALLGIFFLLRRPRTTGTLFLAAVTPLFLLVGSARVVFPRYLLPLLPFLVLAAAMLYKELLDRKGWLRHMGFVLFAFTLVYTSAMTLSQLKGLEPRNALLASDWITEHVAPGSEIAVAVTTWTLTLPADRYGVHSFKLDRALRGSYRPRWLVVSGWYETAFERGGLRHGRPCLFIKSLGSPASGYELKKAFESRYFNEGFYGRLDPYFKNQFESPDFKVFRRRDE